MHTTDLRLCLIATALLALTALPTAAPAEDEWQPGKYMTQALGKIMASARNVAQKTKFGLDDGSTFLVCDPRGDVDASPDEAHGFFFRDTPLSSHAGC